MEDTNLRFLGFDNDVNGNNIAKFGTPGERSFSVQTNKPQLQGTHELRSYKPEELSKEDLETIENEITEFIKNFGSEKQQKHLQESKKIKENKNYYQGELDKIDTNSEYPPKIKITGGEGGETKNIDINEESAKTLIK